MRGRAKMADVSKVATVTKVTKVTRVAEVTKVGDVAGCTLQAAHTRDHDHGHTPERCHPHSVQVVFLGHQALAVCHDCCTDSGFLPSREAERLAEGHRDETRDTSVPLIRAVAS